MDIFGDKRYENLDWITKATEPYVYDLNEVLASLPDSYELSIADAAMIISKVGEWGLRYVKTNVILPELISKWYTTPLSQEKTINLMECYAFEVDGKPVLDFNKKTITGGKLLLKKTKESFNEDEIKHQIGREGNILLKSLHRDNASLERTHEILDLIGGESAEKGLKKRSVTGKLMYLREAYSKIMYQNKWNIRNVSLSLDVAKWICSYIEDGNLGAMTNFCRFKAMTHRGYPIYSIEEENAG